MVVCICFLFVFVKFVLSTLYCKQGRGDGSRIKMVRYTSPVISTSTIFFFLLKRKSYKHLGTYNTYNNQRRILSKCSQKMSIVKRQQCNKEFCKQSIAVCATVDIYWSVYKDRQITSGRADFTQDCLCLSNVYFQSLE